jgi:hypothetical protein
MRNLLRTKNNRRGKDYHLQRMMGSDQRTKDLTQTCFSFICGLPLQLQQKNMVTIWSITLFENNIQEAQHAKSL